MKFLFILDIAAFKDERQAAQDRCLLTVSRLIQGALQLEDSRAIRWGYRTINTQCEPEAFATRYRMVAGHPDDDFPAGSPLQKGALDASELMLRKQNIITYNGIDQLLNFRACRW